MGMDVEAASVVVQRVMDEVCRHKRGPRGARDCGCDGLTPTKAERLVGQMVMESVQLRLGAASNTDAFYGKWKARLGVVVTAETFTGGSVGRLDWSTMTEVAA